MSKRPTDDLEPSAKRGKRGSDRQLTKDDPEGGEDEQPALAGTFSRASEDELKGRRIIKARRGPKTEAASANPFAGINLISSSANPFAGVSLLAPQPATLTAQAQSSPASGVNSVPAADTPLTQQPKVNGASPSSSTPGSSSIQPSAAAPGPVTPASTPAKSAAPSPKGFSSFAANSELGFAATASSASGFAFGNASALSAASGAGAAADGAGDSLAAAASQAPAASFSFSTLPAASASSFPSMQSIFGAGSSTDAPHVFGSGSASAKPAVELSEADTKNGEEDEESAFHGDGKLFQFVQQQWRERGSGDMRLKVNSSGQARVVMRQRGNLKLLLNANLFPGMTHDIMDGGKGAMFQAMNYVDAKEDTGGADKLPSDAGLTTFAFKSKQPGVVSNFDAAVKQHKLASGPDAKK